MNGFSRSVNATLYIATGSYVGGQCKYDRMFGDLDQDAWDCYPNKEQEEDVELLEDAVESNEELYYYASW